MLIQILFAVLVQASQPAISQTSQLVNSQASVVQAPLWRAFEVSMSPSQVRDELLKMPDIKEVKLETKKKKFKGLNIKYDEDKINIGDMSFELEFYFDESERLLEVSLVSDDCYSTQVAKAPNLINALKEKYGLGVSEKVVDDQGAEIRTQAAFHDKQVRVRLHDVSYNPAADTGSGSYSGSSGALNALAALADSLAESERQKALQKCSGDQGGRNKIYLSYSSQEEFLREQNERNRKSDLNAKNLKDSL